MQEGARYLNEQMQSVNINLSASSLCDDQKKKKLDTQTSKGWIKV